MVNQVLTLFLPPARSSQARREGRDRDRARDVRRHPVDARAAGECGGAAGTAGAPLPGQPRPEPPIRLAHRLYRRPARDDASRRRPDRRRHRAGAGLEPAVCRRRRGHLLPVPPPPALERGAGLLDGLGTQARQAAGIQSAAARRPRYELCRDERRPGEPAADPLCDHARRRHADAARHGRPPGGNAGPPAQSAAVRRELTSASSRATACFSRGSAFI